MKLIFGILMFLGMVTFADAQHKEEEHVSHKQWDELLKKHVNDAGKVNYDGFKNDVAKLDEYLKLIGSNEAKSTWTVDERKAFWFNAYNAWTIKLILDRYPVNSIKEVSAKPWDKRFVKIGKITHTLNDIENKIIRRQFNDSRIHFALNCASNSCPKLSNEAFTMYNVEKKMTALRAEFFKSDNLQLTEKEAKISKIFEWYKEDFEKETGSILEYIKKYSGMTFHKKVKITYLEYDWKLNKQ